MAQLTHGDFCYTFIQYQQPCDVDNIPSYLFRLTTRIVQIHQSLDFLSQGFRNAVGDICLYMIYSCRPRRFRLFLRRPIVHHGHSCRLLGVYIVHVVVATQELITQRYLLPVLQIHSSDDRFYFVVETSNDVSDRVCRRLRSEGLQQPRVHQGHFHGVLHHYWQSLQVTPMRHFLWQKSFHLTHFCILAARNPQQVQTTFIVHSFCGRRRQFSEIGNVVLSLQTSGQVLSQHVFARNAVQINFVI